jgi:hypothetical protein
VTADALRYAGTMRYAIYTFEGTETMQALIAARPQRLT